MSSPLTPEVVKLLALTPAEKKLLELVQEKPVHVSELSRLSHIPRTTLYTAIHSLKSRELISTRKKGKTIVVSPIRTNILETIKNSHVEEQNAFIFFYGREAMLKVWEDLSMPPNNRMYCIQPTRSMLSLLKNTKPGEFIPTNETIKKNEVIVETLLREDLFPTYLNLYKGDIEVQKQLIQSFIGRMNDTTLVDTKYLNNNSDMLIGDNGAYLMNWQTETGIKIKDKDMIALLMELFNLAKGYGKKIDLNEYMKGMLEKIEK